MTEGKIVTQDNLDLYTIENNVEGARGQIVMVHGYTEHCRRYDELVSVFNDQGYNVIRYDQRGYGKSEGKRAYINSFQQYIDDLDLVVKKKVDESLPVLIAGASMGALVITKYLTSKDHNMSGAILIAPALKISEDISPFLRKISGFLGKYFPWLKTIKLDSSHLSRDPKVIEDYLSDPLVYKKGAYARTASEMVRETENISSCFSRFESPVLILHGSGDKITDAQGSKDFFAGIASKDKTMKIFEGLYHEICNEEEKEDVFDEIRKWLSLR